MNYVNFGKWRKQSPDTLLYQLPEIHRNRIVSTRAILSDIAKIFDPLGLLGPSIIVAKITVQKLWALYLQ